MKHFKLSEFWCRCGECVPTNLMMPDFLDGLDAIRDELGEPMVVTSGYRCPLHPIEARKLAPGPHQTGLAANIAGHGAMARRLVYLAIAPGYSVGLMQKGDIAGRYIHIDACEPAPGRPRPWIWTY